MGIFWGYPVINSPDATNTYLTNTDDATRHANAMAMTTMTPAAAAPLRFGESEGRVSNLWDGP